jgi:MFS family permease
MTTFATSTNTSLSRAQHASWKRDLRLLAASRGISMFGFEAGHVALLALVWKMTGSANSAAVVLLAAVTARAVSGPLSGWIGDRFKRTRVMVISEIWAAACFASIAIAESVEQVLVLVLAGTLAQSVFGPALDASLPNLVPKDELTRANAVLGMSRTVGHMLGPVIGGIAIATVGARSVFVFDAATSLIAGALILFLRGDCGGRALKGDKLSKAERSIVVGFRLVMIDPVLRLLAFGWCALCVAFALITAAELPLAAAFGVGSTGYAAIITCWCFGSLIGSWFARRVQIVERGATILVRNSLACAVLFTLAGATPWFAGVLVCMVCGGASMALAETVDATLQQQRVADSVRSRVSAAFQSILAIVFGIHLATGGLMVEAVGPHVTYMLSGVWCALAAVGFVLLRRALRASADLGPVRA